MNKLSTLAKSSLALLVFAMPSAKALADEPVLLPVTIAQAAEATPAFSTLYAAVVKAGLGDFLSGKRQLTVFAPDNDAFNAAAVVVLGDENATGLDLVDALDKDTLAGILAYHVCPGERFAEDVLETKRFRTISKQFFTRDGLTLNAIGSSANLNANGLDIHVLNGVIHTIDFVLLPFELTEE
jgi:uncharacterized surface protein with fasciclin (FAS1) repeats